MPYVIQVDNILTNQNFLHFTWVHNTKTNFLIKVVDNYLY